MPLLLLRVCPVIVAMLFAGIPAAAGADSQRPRTDEQILKSLTLPAGYEATVFAKAPEVGYPTQISAAIDGTLFVAVDENGSIDQHRNTPEKARGYVLRVRDTDGDGKADEFKRFAEMESPRGVIWDGPSGTAPGTLYVMHPPNLTAFTDTDGDGKADKQETIVSGLGFGLDFRGADHTTNGCRLAIDGFIYIAVGDYGFTKAVAKDGTALSMRGGGIVRVRPDGTGFEIISRGQRNIYDVAISPTLDLFTRDNTNDGGGWNVRLSHVPPGAQMGYPTLFKNFPEDIVPALADFGGGSPCGALWIDEPGLQNGLYTVEWGSNAIMFHPLKQKGAGWELDPAGATDPKLPGQVKWLGITRPTDMDVDAAGRIYIASWEGATFTYNGSNAGYVVRVVKKDAPALSVPDLAKGSVEQLGPLVWGPSATSRLAAQREAIRRMKSGEMKSILPPQNSRGTRAVGLNMIAAYAILFEGARLNKRGVDSLAEYCKSTPLHQAFLALIDSTPSLATPALIALAAESLKHTDPRIRAAAITALRRLGKVDAAPHILPLVADEDAIISHLAISALSELTAIDVCLKALDRSIAKDIARDAESSAGSPTSTGGSAVTPSSDERLKIGALQALYGIHEPAVVDGLIARLQKVPGGARDPRALSGDPPESPENRGDAHTASSAGSPKTAPESGAPPKPFDLRRGILNALCRLAMQDAPYLDPKEWWGTRPDTSGPVYKPVAWSETPKIVAALKAELDRASDEDARWLAQRMYLTKVNVPGLIELMLAKAGADTAAKLTAIEGLFSENQSLPAQALSALAAIAGREQEPPELRAQALRQLARASERSEALDTAIAAFAPLAGHDLPHAALTAAFEEFTRDAKHTRHIPALAIWAEKDALRRSLAQTILVNLATSTLVKGKEHDAAVAAVEKLWAQPENAATLLAVIARTGAKAYAEQVRARLNDPHNAVAEAALFAFQKLGLKQAAPAMQIAAMKYDEVFAAVQKGGEAALGKEVYPRAGCVACHTIAPDEPLKGPVLSAAAKIYDRAALTESILKPNAKIAQGFETQWFKLSGEELEGFVTREAGDSLDVRNIAGTVVTLPKSTITARGHRPHSMMPEGLMNGFTAADLANLLAYLESLRR